MHRSGLTNTVFMLTPPSRDSGGANGFRSILRSGEISSSFSASSRRGNCHQPSCTSFFLMVARLFLRPEEIRENPCVLTGRGSQSSGNPPRFRPALEHAKQRPRRACDGAEGKSLGNKTLPEGLVSRKPPGLPRRVIRPGRWAIWANAKTGIQRRRPSASSRKVAAAPFSALRWRIL